MSELLDQLATKLTESVMALHETAPFVRESVLAAITAVLLHEPVEMKEPETWPL